jgi:hypothetical protein
MRNCQYFIGPVAKIDIAFQQPVARFFGSLKSQGALFAELHFLHTSNGFSMILTHVKDDFGCHGAKPLILHRFYKQNEIACILLFGVLEGLRGALRQSRFVSCFKTPARITVRRLDVTFLALVPVGSEIEFRRRSDLQVAQNEFFQNCRNSTNINENQSKCQVFNLL